MSRSRALKRGVVLAVIGLVLPALGAGALGWVPALSPPAGAQTAGWQYQVGANPDFGGRTASRTTARLQYTTTGNILNPADSGNWYAYWTAASDLWYSPNWYQVGYAIFQPANPYGIPQHWAFVQSTAASGYFWCNAAYGFTLTNGALGQADAGCSGDADVFGMALGFYYNFEIVVTDDPASGPDGPIYGCNGNVRFLIGGIEVGHLADCSSGGGMTGISASVLEPTSAYGVTPKSATNLYRNAEIQSSFQAVIDGVTTRPTALTRYCGYSPPRGAGSIIDSNIRARSRTYSASCPVTTAALAAPATTDTPAAVATPGPSVPVPSPTVPAGQAAPAGRAPAPASAAVAGGAGRGSGARPYDPARGSLPLLKPSDGRGRNSARQPAAAAGMRAPALPPPTPADP